MFVLATLHEAIPGFLMGVGVLIAIGFVDYGLYRFGRKHDGPPRLLFWLAGLVLSFGGAAVAALILLLSWLLVHCPPDAYECPT